MGYLKNKVMLHVFTSRQNRHLQIGDSEISSTDSWLTLIIQQNCRFSQIYVNYTLLTYDSKLKHFVDYIKATLPQF